MRRHNIVSWILLILTVITFALAAPVLVQEKRQARVDLVHIPEHVITVLGKRVLEEDLNVLWDDWWHFENVLGEPANAPLLVPNLALVHVVPHSPTDSSIWSTESGSELTVPDDHIMQPSSPDSVHSHPQSTTTSNSDRDRESMELNNDALPKSPESGHSHSLPTSPEWSTESEDWHSPPTSPEGSTKSEDWNTAPSSLGPSGSDSGSDSDSDRWSMTSNAPSAESQSENLNVVDYELKGKAKVERRISGTASGVDMVNAAQMEWRRAVDPGP